MLEIKGLDVFYGAVHALKGVNMKVHEGTTVALVGANGAGKSTLLNAISGLVAYRGEILYKGSPLPRVPHKIVSLGIVHIPEGRQIFANLTVHENLLAGAYCRWSRSEIKENLERVYALFPVLKERQGQYAGTLSGGERQMLALGRGLMSRPGMLLVDEPSLGLSPLLTNQVLGLIQEVNRQGVTVLLVEQNARKSLAIADYAYVLQTGRIVKEGKGRDLLNDPFIRDAYFGADSKRECRA
ncbi:MAG TPA: ABC transporter ATP-binding protein [Firmicutes bacterium]|nr:ABC transporter ATP-binding protein [Bacillota bacterium]